MTQVDHEHVVRGGSGDAKVACETLIGDPLAPYADPDMPAESVRIRMDDDSIIDWLDSIHPVYERDDSTKGTTNPKSQLHAHHQNPNPNPSSQRFSGNLKATTKAHIIGLPGAGIQHPSFIGHSARRHLPPIFPKNGANGKPAGVAVADPGSPKVSCFGKVLSDRDRRNPSPAADEESAGCWSCFGRRRPPASPEKASPLPEGNIPVRRSDAWSGATSTTEPPAPPGLGAMKRFVSGRRSASWGGDADAGLEGGEEGHVAWSGPLVER